MLLLVAFFFFLILLCPHSLLILNKYFTCFSCHFYGGRVTWIYTSSFSLESWCLFSMFRGE